MKFLLAVYFFRIYSQKKTGVPLILGTGFSFFGLSQIPILSSRYFDDPTTNMYFGLLGAFLAALSLALLYYGTSLLYFKADSFMRKRFSTLLFVIMLAVILCFPFTLPTEAVLKNVFMVVATGFIFPILTLVAVIFFYIWVRLEPENPRKTSVFLVAAAWLTYSAANGIGSFYFGTAFDWIFYTLCIVAFLVLLYGMTLGKATGH
ncbi:MAG: hypothetical protein HXS41_05415 [Theionarchaea archaeon]|nr:hypothetical protein [Theionarchaea archaeon]MBU7000573.1 hypothetical protein [Theionarchaea archaeon]MBU7020475.1 hypothetical protein [Theionarchaea archaeon]MBU7039768.1 hypothetical protein [Theionarchaea archaeon]